MFQPHAAQLTARAILVGMAIGGVMCLSNPYMFFKTGWSMGVTITAGILAFALFQLLHLLGLQRAGEQTRSSPCRPARAS